MSLTLFRSGLKVSQDDVQGFAEFLRNTDGGETKMHRLFEAHPAIIGALGFIEFLSEVPLKKRGTENEFIIDNRGRDRADIVAARLSIASNLEARKFANLIELKGARARVLESNSQRRSDEVDKAVKELRSYAGWLKEVPNRETLSRFGWDVWDPWKYIIMGSMAEFANPGLADQLKQQLLDSDGVRLILVDELLALVESVRLQHSAILPPNPTEGLVGFNDDGRFSAPLIDASGGLAGFVLASRRLSGAVTSYGNIVVSDGVPQGLVHVKQSRLQPLARTLNVPFAEAVVGFNGSRRYGYKAEKHGIIVADFDERAIIEAAMERDARNEPLRARREQRRRAEAQKRQELAQHARAEALRRAEPLLNAIREMFPALPQAAAEDVTLRATEPGLGRVGTNQDLELKEVAWLAVAAHAAYGHLRLGKAAYANQELVRSTLVEWGGPCPEEVLRPQLLTPESRSSRRAKRPRTWRGEYDEFDEYE